MFDCMILLLAGTELHVATGLDTDACGSEQTLVKMQPSEESIRRRLEQS